ncbi:hypothetical protein [Desulfurispora thermophila]|uniref:hypothetical protein n=1 Tax=Desulfurispora thermophila TaxID=265470 RepID=UPI0003803E97|nr:hypothetical protein [Desulfurispora thermophila]
MIKNPAFGIYVADDESYTPEPYDPRVNVEAEALARLQTKKKSAAEGPAGDSFAMWTDKNGTTVIIYDEDGRPTKWTSPPSPCRGPAIEWLCDGYVPTCHPYQPVSEDLVRQGYAPAGCKAYRKCARNWTKEEIAIPDQKRKWGEENEAVGTGTQRTGKGARKTRRNPL